ncbi:MAG: NfeD family protein [Bacteroidaceae bacterium]|nr:NfeD family protein [Bacteroidaceae bacterium]
MQGFLDAVVPPESSMTWLEMYQNQDTWMQVFWGCAIVGSLIFLVQMVLTLMGMDHSDMDVDFDGADTMDLGGGISLFSIKNFVNFIVGFGWGGVCFADAIENKWLLTLVAVAVGVGFVLMFFFIKKQTKRLEHNGAFRIEDSVGKTVDVYLRIPAGKSGAGKVQVSLNGSVQELEALTEGNSIPSGQKVKVVGVIDGSTVLVAPNPSEGG